MNSLFGRQIRFLGLLALLAVVMTMGMFSPQSADAAPGEVLILAPTVTGGLASLEATKVVAAGRTPVVVDAVTWAAMTTADFADYDAIVLGDPNCVVGEGPVAAAIANAAVWGAAVDGNVIIIGTDPTFHQGQGGDALTEKGMAFAVDEPGKTGAYITTSCYYHFSVSGTPVPFLDGISGGGFTVLGASSIPGLNDVEIVATHPALVGLTDAQLSNWGNSVHAGFETWPLDFEVLAIARDAAGPFTAPSGTVGFPYILARGVQVISDITLSPDTDVNEIGDTHAVTATVVTDDPAPGTPVVGTEVTFTVIAGPHAGLTATSTTDGSGQATFSYVGVALGVDTIEATFVDALGRTQRSNRVTKEWIEPREIVVSLDIHPTSCPNPLNMGRGGVLPAAILGTAGFDVSQIDVSTLQLEGVTPLRSALEDVAAPYGGGISDPPDRKDCTTDGPDGFLDLTLKFDAQAVVAALGPVSRGDVVVVTLTGALLDGTPIVGSDVIWIR